MRKIPFLTSVCILLLCVCSFIVTAAPTVTASTYKATVKNLKNGTYEITFDAAPKNWVMVHLQLSDFDRNSNFAAFTIEQVKPLHISNKRIFVYLKSDAKKADFFRKELRRDLRDNKPHRYSFSVPDGKKLGCISLAVDRPAEPVVLKISNIVLEKRNLKARKVNTPLPPVIFKGKPFFPIGAFDMMPYKPGATRGEIDPEFLAAGGNIGFIGQVSVPEHPLYTQCFQPAMEKALQDAAVKAEFADLALLVDLSGIWVDDSQLKSKGYWLKPVGKDLERRKKLLANALKMCSNNPNIIGYYLDEPENIVYRYYSKMYKSEWDKKRDIGLAEVMLDWSSWIRQAVRQYHPSAKMMITLGWWTTYEVAADMYDVNIPNEYNAEGNPDRLFQTNYDAAMAVAAARKAGKGKTVVYMPGMFNILAGSRAKPATLEAQRYCTFAPITRGVMGIFGWRLGRCSTEYRQKIVYPVMKEVSNFKDYFLGEWHDELVTSDHDTATADYLKKYQARNSLVIGKDDGDYLNQVDMVPDVSYCLRRNPATGKYLLLAVNNRREPVKVTFNIDLEKLPASVKCAFDNTGVIIKNKTMTCEFKRFGVHAFEFELRK